MPVGEPPGHPFRCRDYAAGEGDSTGYEGSRDGSLKYVLVSHMESDEAAGVFALREAYPDLPVVCGNLAARELTGFGYTCKVKAVSGGQTLMVGDLECTDRTARCA